VPAVEWCARGDLNRHWSLHWFAHAPAINYEWRYVTISPAPTSCCCVHELMCSESPTYHSLASTSLSGRCWRRWYIQHSISHSRAMARRSYTNGLKGSPIRQAVVEVSTARPVLHLVEHSWRHGEVVSAHRVRAWRQRGEPWWGCSAAITSGSVRSYACTTNLQLIRF
jgi:hypothetical protein